jgi:feruloyl esterase
VSVLSCVGSDRAPATTKPLACDLSLKKVFAADKLTNVLLVKAYKRGEPLVLSEPVTARTIRAAHDLCLVKVSVGPGHPGPADAPSTSAGIGIEIWLPAASVWNERVHVVGGGGWVGGDAASPTRIGAMRAISIAQTEGAVTSMTDAGHGGTDPGLPSSGGAYMMNPDGTINKALWNDFASRSLHEQAVKTKELATAYYGRAPKYSYWDGASTGGRQAINLAQNHPEDFDGIIASLPALYWTRFTTAALYPHIAFQRDLASVPLSHEQQDLVSNAAIQACDVVGGQHLGYIMDEAACRYDPTQDPKVLCARDDGNNTTPTCVTKIQANVFNKIWYGLTSDGSVPLPAVDNGWDKQLEGVHRWYGLPRGTSLHETFLYNLFHVPAGHATVPSPWSIPIDQVALELQNPTLANATFKNATGDGADLWKTLSYVQLANAFDRGIALQPVFGYVNTENPDLSAFKARGGKMLTWHGINDEVIQVQGTVHYYKSVIENMGGLDNVQIFYRLYLVPGNGHGPHNGTSNKDAYPPEPGDFYPLLVDWVEKGIAPGRIDISTPPSAPVHITQPICPYPQKATYTGGDPRATTSYICR